MADLVLLLVVNHYITLIPTILLVVSTGIAGAWLARRQWKALLLRARNRAEDPGTIADLFSDGSMILIAAVLLITPGLITDTLGLTMLIPVCRRWYQRQFVAWVKSSIRVQVFTGTMPTHPANPEIVEGNVAPRRTHPNSDDDHPDRLDASPF